MKIFHRTLRAQLRAAAAGGDAAAAPAADAPISLVASTDTPVSRCGGMFREILAHDPAAVTLAARSVLFNHDPNQIVGKVVNPKLDGNRVTAEIQFAPTEAGRELDQLVRGGFVDGVSIGYTIDRFSRTEDSNGQVTIRADAWTLREITITPIPADLNAGIGRAADDESFLHRFGVPMEPTVPPKPQTAGAPPQTTTTHDEAARAAELASLRAEKETAERALSLRELAESHGVTTEGIDFRSFKTKEEGITALLARKAKNDVTTPANGVSAAAAPGVRSDEHDKAAAELIERITKGARYSDELRRLGHKFGVRGIGTMAISDLIDQGADGFHAMGKRTTVISSGLGLVTQLAAAKVMLDAFAAYGTQYKRWTKEVFVPDFNTVTISDLGFAEFAAASGEGEAYADNSPAIIGGSGSNEFLGTNFDISLVALYNDRAGLVFDRLANLGRTAAMTLDKISQTTLAAASFANATQALALSEANLPTVWAAHSAVTLKGAVAKILIVPMALYPTARSIVTPANGATAGRIYAAGQPDAIDVIQGWYLSDANDWYLGADPQLAPMVVVLRHPDYQGPRLVAKGEGGGPNALFRVDFPAKAVLLNTATGKPLCGYKATQA